MKKNLLGTRGISTGLALALGCLAALTTAACSRGPVEPDPEYVAEIEAWHDTRIERLRRPDGWLSLVGLHWLGEGASSFGSDPAADIVLRGGAVPARAGVFELQDGRVSVRAEPGVPLVLDGGEVAAATLRSDADEGGPDVLGLGRLSIRVISRGERLGLRVIDPESPTRLGFRGIETYPVDPRFRFAARFTPHEPPREISIPTVLGTTETGLSPGYVEFDHDGRTHRLEPVVQDVDDPMWFYIFRDETSGEETYGSGRFLYAPAPVDGIVDLDFNRSYNPPCAFTPFATCPLPPRENRLDVRIEAGEKRYGDH